MMPVERAANAFTTIIYITTGFIITYRIFLICLQLYILLKAINSISCDLFAGFSYF